MTTQAYSYSENIFLGNLFPRKSTYSNTAEIVVKWPVESYPLNEEGLTNLAMQLAETSLAKEWEQEDDDYWASFPSIK